VNRKEMGGNLERGFVLHLEGLGGPLNHPGSGLDQDGGVIFCDWFHKKVG